MPDNYITLSQLTKTTKGLVNKINAESIIIDSKIGDLTELETTVSTDLVSAINELAEGSGSAGVTSFNGQTGAVTYTAPVTSVNGNTGAVTLTIPTQVSDLNNDAGYITTETDPTVPAWAKESTKPTYTASEVGAQATISISKNNTTTPDYPLLQSSTGSFNSHISDEFRTAIVSNVRTLYIGTTITPRKSGAIALANSAIGNYATIETNGGMSSNATLTLPASSGTLALEGKIKTTAGENNTEYNLIGVQNTYTNSGNTTPYNPGLITFAKTTDIARLTIGSTSIPGVVRVYSSADSASGFTDIKSGVSSTNERTITLPDASGTVALTDDIPSVPSWAMTSSKPSYTFSELTTHPTTISGYGITDAYTKTEVDGLVSGVLHYKGTKATVSALPSSGNVTGDVWHITADGSEWAWDGSDWQELGTAVDLTGYLQSSDIAAWAKAANKPSYTASEVGALPSSTTYVSSFNGNSGAITYTAPVTSVNNQTGAVTLSIPTAPGDIGAAASSHAHGNITSGGDMTATAAIASGDRLVINDESASKLVSSTITFGSSTTQYLANNGTWQNAYDDTALAARVSALEQIPWVTYYTGSSTPSNSQGNNGDLYFQTSQ